MPAPSPDTRERILDTAETLFAERGFAATPVRDIAAAVGLTPASLYNHFEGKEALYAAVLERGIRPLFEVMDDLAAREHGPDAMERAIGSAMEHLARHPNVARLVHQEAVTGGARLFRLAGDWIRAVTARALGEMKRAVDSPWSEEEHRLVVAMWVQLTVGYFATAPLMAELLREDPLSPEAVARQTAFLKKLARQVTAGGTR